MGVSPSAKIITVLDSAKNKEIYLALTDDTKLFDEHQLQKLFKSTLEKINWRLMSEGLNYKLGILSGRLRGYENEEDLLKLVRINRG